MKNQIKQLGFTLVEAIVVMAILAAIAAAAIPRLARIADDNTVSSAAEEMRHILVAAREHRLTTGAWPADVNVLVAANRLPASAVASPFDTNYALAPVGINQLQITVDTRMNKFASKLVGMNLPFVARVGTVISAQTTPAGEEASNAALYALDGSRLLTGNMNANGNNINNVNTLNATNVVSTDDVRANDDLIAGNDLEVVGNGHVFGSLLVDSNITSGGNINASGNVQASGDLIGLNDVYGRRFFDRDDPSFVMNPNGNSNLQNLNLQGELRFQGTVSEGQPCVSGNVGISTTGQLLTCKFGIYTRDVANISSSTSVNGFMTFNDANGISFRWGQIVVSTSFRDRIVTTYPNACLNVQVSVNSFSAAGGDAAMKSYCNGGQVHVINTESSTRTIYWFSVGF